MLKADDFIKSKLVETGWRFGQSYAGGHIAAQMVMNTLANRFRLGWGPWLQIIEGIPNFMAENELPPITYPSIWDGAFIKLLHAVDGIFDGSAQDLSKGALYWADLRKIERPWFQQRILDARKEDGLPAHTRVADMNSLSFWK